MLYAIIVLLLICCVYIYDIYKCTSYKYIVFYSFIGLLIFLNVFSYQIGGDTPNYIYSWKNEYKSIFEMNLFDEFELRSRERPGWIILTSLLKGVCDDIIILRLVLACWVNLIVAYFIRHNTRFVFSALLMYFVVAYFNYNFEILRESISVTFFLLAYKYYENGSWLKYFGCFLCAFMFHESSLVMLILPLFRLFDNVGSRKMAIVALSAYLVFISLDLVSILTNVVPDSFSFYVKFQSYMESETYGVSKVSNRLLSFLSSVCGPLVSFFILRRDPEKKILSLMIFISVVFNILTSNIFIFYRFANYIMLPLLIAYIDVVFLLSKKFTLGNSRLILFVPMLLIYLIYKVDSVYFSGAVDETGMRFYDRYYPYTFIFDNGKSKW